jgi:hypothetical protein
LKHLLLLALLALLATACTTIAPGAERIRITSDPKDVAGCRAVGEVDAAGPFNGPDDWKNQLRNAALPLGADVVFRTGPLAFTRHVTGMAYRCDQPKP